MDKRGRSTETFPETPWKCFGFQQDQCNETLRRHEHIELTLSPAYDRLQIASSLPDIHSKNNPFVPSQSKDNQLLLSDTDKVKSEEQLFDTSKHSRNCCHGIIDKWKDGLLYSSVLYLCQHILFHTYNVRIHQGSATYGPRAGSGPPCEIVRPETH
ncbi:unnamed protein product [Clavelina lepadiformis]|uniref:Uncharacterized protein n=1 Tax=Clavelina lepadiformis TaxID=159417 RepID=A0ABP0GB47_CLALP